MIPRTISTHIHTTSPATPGSLAAAILLWGFHVGCRTLQDFGELRTSSEIVMTSCHGSMRFGYKFKAINVRLTVETVDLSGLKSLSLMYFVVSRFHDVPCFTISFFHKFPFWFHMVSHFACLYSVWRWFQPLRELLFVEFAHGSNFWKPRSQHVPATCVWS